jgi:hypothetical protein
MPKTRVNCPNCRQPILSEIEQLFDVNIDPAAKNRLLSGAVNVISCPNCGYQGNLATPIVYHDPDKELLLTYFPPELGLSRDEQERIIGGLITQVVNKLPQEKRKAYLFRPQSVLTVQGLLERVLEADGVTREMIQAQQQRLSLLQRLLGASPEVREEIIKNEENLIDAEFFALLSRLGQVAMAGGDQVAANQMAELQKVLLSSTSFGKNLQDQAKEVEAAIASLREIGADLTREKLLDLVVEAPNNTRVSVLVSLVRPAMDYEFFQLLSERIDRGRGDGRARLINLREKLLELTREVDRQTETRIHEARQLIATILQSDNIEKATQQVLPNVDELFMQVLADSLEAARKQGDLEKIGKLQMIERVIQEASTPPEIELIEKLLQGDNEQERRQILLANREKVTPELLDALTSIVAQMDEEENQQLAQQMKEVYRLVLRVSMESNL